jgi:hypothetical protein
MFNDYKGGIKLSDTVLGIFDNLKSAEKAMAEIQRMGYSKSEIGIQTQGLEDTRMQQPHGFNDDSLNAAGGYYPNADFDGIDLDDIQGTLSGGSMTSPEHAQTSYVEQGVNAHERESTDDNTTSYAVAGYFNAVSKREDSFHPTYRGYCGVRNCTGYTGGAGDGKTWSQYGRYGMEAGKQFATTVRRNNETMPASRSNDGGSFTGNAGDGKNWSSYGNRDSGQGTTLNAKGNEYVVAVRVDAQNEVGKIVNALSTQGAVDTEVFNNND